jgi:hypothetical protein
MLADYVAKSGSFAQELVRGDRKYTHKDHLNPVELLHAAAQGDEWARRLWCEREKATKGQSLFTYTRGFWALLGEDEAEEEPEQLVGDERVVCDDVSPWQWRRVWQSPTGLETVKELLRAGATWDQSVMSVVYEEDCRLAIVNAVFRSPPDVVEVWRQASFLDEQF